ncbi:MAG TPA: SH3 domain-containing protein [Chryseolinea sp.]|nr:SH3 domain-containing protein [Chryseolinea sp.]
MPATAQVASFRLTQADSLYAKKQYTQSLEHYKAILAGNEYTPAMLLKMAFIEEGLNRPGKALFYLNLYYLATSDKSVLTKMDDLATKFNLDGYKTSDTDLALSFYHDFHVYISLTLCATALFFVSLILFWKRKGKRSLVTGTLLGFILVLLIVHVNIGEQILTGIVGEPNTYLMDGPSAGASVVSVIAEGHRLEIVGKVDVWYKVRWNDHTVFIKDNSLLPVKL